MTIPPDPANKLIPCQRDLFEIPDDVTYLNCANMSPQLRSVTEAGFEAMKAKASAWKITPPDWFADGETLRALAGRIIGADAESMALVPSVSYGIAIAAANVTINRGQSILLLHDEFPSNVYAWRELARQRGVNIRTLRRQADETWTHALLDAIDANTAVVATPNCHWTDGSLIDLVQVGQKVRSVGAALVIDASQSMGAYPLNVAEVQPDFLVSVGYKWLMGPYSLGYLYVSPRWRTEGTPIEHSWISRKGSDNFARLVDYVDEYRPGARRYDVGEFSNFVLVPMGIAAINQVLAWGVENIQRSLSRLTKHIAQNAAELGCTFSAERAGHIIGIRLPNGIPENLGKKLAEARIYVSIRGDSVRIAPHLYNDNDDVERLFRILRELI